jgi:hypothetical protein
VDMDVGFVNVGAKVEGNEKRPPISRRSKLLLWIVGRAAYPTYLLTTLTVACREPFPILNNPL